MKKPKRDRKELQKQWDAAKAEKLACRRKLNTNFLFWTVCQDRSCERARGCAGADPEACFKLWWPHVPEEIKVQFRAYIDGAGRKGMSRDEALAYAEREVARWKADQETCAREIDALVAPAVVPEPVDAPPRGPRIRSL